MTATNRFMARSALSFDLMAVTPLDEPPQPRSRRAAVDVAEQPKFNCVRHDPSPRLVIRAGERRRVKAVRQS